MRAKTADTDREQAHEACGAWLMADIYAASGDAEKARDHARRATKIAATVDRDVLRAVFARGHDEDLLDVDPESPDLLRDLVWRSWRRSLAHDTSRRGGLTFWTLYAGGVVPLLPELEYCQRCATPHALPMQVLADTTCKSCRQSGRNGQ